MKFTEPNFIYILGLLWADGWIGKKGNQIAIQILKEDADYFYTIFSKLDNWKIKYRKQPLNDKLSGTISINNKELYLLLKNNDYKNKSKLSPIKILSLIPKELHFYFYRGWVDGDGCFYYHQKYSLFQFIITSSYEQDWISFENVCKELNCKYYIKRILKTKNNYSQIKILNKKNLPIIGSYLYNNYENDKIGLKRKYEKYQQILNHNLK